MKRLSLLTAALMASPAFAATWTSTYDSTTGGGGYYDGVNATVVFNDWGYAGPTVNGYTVGANDFQVGSGYDSTRIGQIQTVVTQDPDWNTPDPSWNSSLKPSLTNRVVADDGSGVMPDANMDTQVNFYKWGYTTVGGSTFNSMTIDKAGNYFVARNDMQFQFYDTFMYNDGSTVTDYDTAINFQPYAVSDARGWCGSVLQSNPNGLEYMAGQVTFDFAFDAYMGNSHPGVGVDYATQIVPDFVMRSYGDYSITVNNGVDPIMNYVGSAVVNNTNPLTGLVDPSYQNQVSFLGGGVVPKGVWIFGEGAGVIVAEEQGVAGIEDGETRASDGATWHQNSFAGYGFLLRADGSRTLTFIAPDGHSDYVTTDPAAYESLAAIPEPETYAMMLAGIGLVGGVAWRRKRAA